MTTEATGDDNLRTHLSARLQSGLKTEVEPRGYTSEEITRITVRLQRLSSTALDEKLAVAGFTLIPYAPPHSDDDLQQSCETCMYYVTHRRFCELPELNLPVEKDWSCRLWRI